jgi:molybdate transport system ATP-binding protein
VTGALAASIRTGRGSFALDLELQVQPGQTLALLGPNGAGKSTTIGCIAGIVHVEDGLISVGDTVLDDTTRAISVPVEQRRVGLVFQDYRLFPHLSVLENIAFGQRARGVSRHEARDNARDWLDRFGLAQFASSRPESLSGGQSQRVALARALAIEPDVLLLDEPLAALDVEIRADVRAELADYLSDFAGATIVVTHDLADAAALADRVAVIERGRQTQLATVAELRENPATAWVSRLVAR